MIIGEYPCCHEPLMMALPDGVQLPVFFSENCPNCGAKVWHRLSRASPESWTEENFLAKFDVNSETKVISPK